MHAQARAAHEGKSTAVYWLTGGTDARVRQRFEVEKVQGYQLICFQTFLYVYSI